MSAARDATTMPIVLATRSGGKLRELAPLVEAAGFRPVTLDEAGVAADPAEDAIEAFDTFEENALAKARWFQARSGGRAVLADDSGLSVDALGGAPGVRSKRWAAERASDTARDAARDTSRAASGLALDEANNRALLAALEDTGNRSAMYVCVAVIAWSGGVACTRGACTGRVLREALGSLGFGYDPLFRSDELGKTFGEATREEKAGVSHRGRAVTAVLVEFARRMRDGGG